MRSPISDFVFHCDDNSSDGCQVTDVVLACLLSPSSCANRVLVSRVCVRTGQNTILTQARWNIHMECASLVIVCIGVCCAYYF